MGDGRVLEKEREKVGELTVTCSGKLVVRCIGALGICCFGTDCAGDGWLHEVA